MFSVCAFFYADYRCFFPIANLRWFSVFSVPALYCTFFLAHFLYLCLLCIRILNIFYLLSLLYLQCLSHFFPLFYKLTHSLCYFFPSLSLLNLYLCTLFSFQCTLFLSLCLFAPQVMLLTLIYTFFFFCRKSHGIQTLDSTQKIETDRCVLQFSSLSELNENLFWYQ